MDSEQHSRAYLNLKLAQRLQFGRNAAFWIDSSLSKHVLSLSGFCMDPGISEVMLGYRVVNSRILPAMEDSFHVPLLAFASCLLFQRGYRIGFCFCFTMSGAVTLRPFHTLSYSWADTGPEAVLLAGAGLENRHHPQKYSSSPDLENNMTVK
jgi:hypothetical protein